MAGAHIFGPLISTGDLVGQVRLFTEVFGMTEATRMALDEQTSAALFGTPGHRVTIVTLTTPGTTSGAVICQFDPPASHTVRDWGTRMASDALKVIDFYAPDYEGALDHARGLGYEVVEDQAAYELDAGTFREAHLWAPDNVVTAFLGGPAEFFADFAQLTDRRCSEVQSISAPVSDAAAVVAFYEVVFGWRVVYEYAITDPSFAALIGADEPLRLRATNVGRSTREPYFGLIDYGVASRLGSLKGRSRPPVRGLIGAVVRVNDLSETLARARQVGGEAAVPVSVTSVEVPSIGVVRAATVLPPHGVWHVVVESAD